MEMGYCSICGFLKPISYDYCPCCVYGVKPGKIGRVRCRGCETTVGEHIIQDQYWEYIEKCDYCDPPEGATEDDIVGRTHVWIFRPDEAPQKYPNLTTRSQRREQLKKSKELFEWLLKVKAEYAPDLSNGPEIIVDGEGGVCNECGQKMALDYRDGFQECWNDDCPTNSPENWDD